MPEEILGKPPYNEAQITGIIPHRRPFLFLGCVDEIEWGQRAVGVL